MTTQLRSPFYGILDTGYVSRSDWTAKYDALAAGGAGIIQIRAKKSDAAERAALLDQIVQHRARSHRPASEQPILIMNDDLELCLRHEGVGLHVGQDDIPAREARERLGPQRVLGLSTHSPEQARAAMELGPQVLSYFAVGPVFATQTKPDYTPVGLELVSFVAQLKPELPFFCIGGINRSNIEQLRDAGGRQIVTVSDALLNDTAAVVAESIRLLGSR